MCALIRVSTAAGTMAGLTAEAVTVLHPIAVASAAMTTHLDFKVSPFR
jgi:hypothetical protein